MPISKRSSERRENLLEGLAGHWNGAEQRTLHSRHRGLAGAGNAALTMGRARVPMTRRRIDLIIDVRWPRRGGIAEDRRPQRHNSHSRTLRSKGACGL
jgi:hypothetical protein